MTPSVAAPPATPFALSELRVEPIVRRVPALKVRLEFWKVWVGLPGAERCFDLARPFEAGDGEIELEACSSCGMAFCGSGFVSLRRAGPHVLWFHPLDEDLDRKPALAPEELHLFPIEGYERVVPNGAAAHLAVLGPDEARGILRRGLPDPGAALAREPASPTDSRGAGVLGALARMIEDPAELHVVEAAPPAAEQREVRVRLDDPPAFPETVVRIGSVGGGPAVACVQHPVLPVWLAGEAVDAFVAAIGGIPEAPAAGRRATR